ncbi:hypothetical protein CONPUDRAFT_39834, partial [Coniophora puteana RWD-64-598 SS2]
EDVVNRNVGLLFRDLLHVFTLVSAISDGDYGRVENMFPSLACMFRGAGGNNYSSEILHMIHNFKHAWTPEFA